jgi:hypothetical protein
MEQIKSLLGQGESSGDGKEEMLIRPEIIE